MHRLAPGTRACMELGSVQNGQTPLPYLHEFMRHLLCAMQGDRSCRSRSARQLLPVALELSVEEGGKQVTHTGQERTGLCRPGRAGRWGGDQARREKAPGREGRHRSRAQAAAGCSVRAFVEKQLLRPRCGRAVLQVAEPLQAWCGELPAAPGTDRVETADGGPAGAGFALVQCPTPCLATQPSEKPPGHPELSTRTGAGPPQCPSPARPTRAVLTHSSPISGCGSGSPCYPSQPCLTWGLNDGPRWTRVTGH